MFYEQSAPGVGAAARSRPDGDGLRSSTVHPVPGHHSVERPTKVAASGGTFSAFFQSGGHRIARHAENSGESP